MKKVIHLLNTNTFSGAENVAITIIINMKRIYKDEFDFYYASPSGQIDNILKKYNIKHIIYKKVSFYALKKIIQKEQPDIIHAHDFTTSVIASFFSNQISVISHLHNNPLWIQKKCLKSYIYKISSSKFSKILLVSKIIEEEFIYREKIHNKSIEIGNPIVLNTDKKNSFIRETDILFVGRITKQKNPIKFIQICSQLEEKYIIKMIGMGDMFEECKQYLLKENISNIEMLGYKSNVMDYMANSKILLMTSDWEGFGLVAVEAMNVGTPVVAHDVGGLHYLIDENCGFLYLEKKQAIDEIKKLLEDNKYWNKKSKLSVKRAHELENIDKYCKQLKNIYMETTNAK